MIIAASVIVSTLLLAGCTSSTSTVTDIYIFSITYAGSDDGDNSLFAQAARGGELVVRAGYFGLCAKQGLEAGAWVCSASAFGIKSILGGENARQDPLDIVDMADHLKSGVVFPGLLWAKTQGLLMR